MENKPWKKYAFEFLSIFIAVVAAFALTNWNDNRKESKAENKILHEILIGLEKDIKDVKRNAKGHEFALISSSFFREIIADDVVRSDSINTHYFMLLRDFISIQNTSGYENLRSRGLELIQNDSLRTEIVSLYEYNYKTLKKLEEDYYEMQFHENYFNKINDHLASHFEYNDAGEINGMKMPLRLSSDVRNRLLSYLMKVESNRKFALKFYKDVEGNIIDLKNLIEQEVR